MLAAVPLFSMLSEKDLSSIAKEMNPGLGLPGEKIIETGQVGTRMFFIAAGAVEVHLPNATVTLEAGDYFGEMALLTSNPRNADVVSKGFCHLLVLDRRDFRRIMRASQTLREHIEKTSAQRQEEDEALAKEPSARH